MFFKVLCKFGALKVHYPSALVAFSRAALNTTAHPHPAFCRGPPRDAGCDAIPRILPIVRPC